MTLSFAGNTVAQKSLKAEEFNIEKDLLMVQFDLPTIAISKCIHVVQHSDWNEKSTLPEDLRFVKVNTDYQKIPDGNVVGNGTPGFRPPNIPKGRIRLRTLN